MQCPVVEESEAGQERGKGRREVKGLGRESKVAEKGKGARNQDRLDTKNKICLSVVVVVAQSLCEWGWSKWYEDGCVHGQDATTWDEV